MTLGKTMDEITTSKEHSKSFVESLIKVVEYIGVLNIDDYIPALAWMDLQVSIVIEVYEYIRGSVTNISEGVLLARNYNV